MPAEIPKKMLGAVVTEFGKPLEYLEVDVPKPEGFQVLVKMICTGVCHTDLHCALGDWRQYAEPKLPVIPGHEGVGEVVKLGPDVVNLKEGDIVGIPWLGTACGYCDYCITSWETLCTKQLNSGYAVDGSFAEYAVADARYVGLVPKDCDYYNMAPIVCAGVTVYKGLKMTEAKTGEWVAISGIGGLGSVAVQYAKVMGLNVIAIDIADDKMKLAKEVGADVTVNVLKEDAVKKIHEATGGAGVHGVLVTAVSPKAFSLATQIMRRRGTMVLVGLPPGTFDLDIISMVLNGITVRGSIVGSRKDLKEAIELAAAGKIHCSVNVEPFKGTINSVFDRMKEGTINGRIVLDFTGKKA